MQNPIEVSPSHLSDAELIAQVKTLAGRERDATAQLIAHLAELDVRDLYLRAGHGSLFVYCRDALGFSEHEAYLLAEDMLSHAIPSGDTAALLDRALTALLAELARQRFAATDRPRPGRATAEGSRHIPAPVKRSVWSRDLGRCAFVGDTGRRCLERRFLEFHHLKPFAVGGESTVAGISLRCRSHNGYEAKLFFARDEDASAGSVRELATPYHATTSKRVAHPDSFWAESGGAMGAANAAVSS